MHTVRLAVVRSMIVNAVQQRIVTGGNIKLCESIVCVIMFNGGLNVGSRVFVFPVVLPFRLGFCPGIEGDGQGRNIIIVPHLP